MKKPIVIAGIVILALALFVGVYVVQINNTKTEIGWGGAIDTCKNESLQAEFKNMGYNVTCYGQNMGSSDLIKLPGDPNYSDKIDLHAHSNKQSKT